MEHTSTFVRKLEGWKGDAALYKVEPPVRYSNYDDDEHETDYVIASSVIALYTGPETLVFPADQDGEAINMLEIGGGRGPLNHQWALSTLGQRGYW